MAEQPIKGTEIIDNDIFKDAIKQSDLLIAKLKDLETQQGHNLNASKDFINAFKGDGSKALKQLNAETVKVTATLSEYEKTQLGIIEVEKKQAQLKAELAKTSREELKLTKDLAKEEAARLKGLQTQNGEYAKASKELSRLKRALQDLEIAEKTNTKEFKELNKQFEDLDKKVRKADASVGNFQRNVGNYPAQLKAIQRELQGLEPGTEQFNKLAQKAGLLKDAIGDAKDATKAFATESKATQAKNLFGQIGNDIADLDFKGAAEKAGQFASVMRSISFAEVISGIKSFATSIIVAGEAILASPIGLFVLVIAALGTALKLYKDTVNMVYEAQSDLNSALRDSNILMEKGRTEYLKSANQTLLLQGKISDKEKQVRDLVLDSKLKQSEAQNKYQDDIKKLLADDDINEFQRKQKLFKISKDFAIATFNESRKSVNDIKNIRLEAANEERDELKKINEDKAKAAKEERDRKIKQAKEDQDAIDKAARDNYADSINREADRYDKDRAKAKQDAKDWEALQREFDSDLERDVKKGEEDAAKNKKERQEKELKEAIEFEKQVLDAFSKAQAEKSKLKIEGYDKELKDADKNIDMQRQLAIKGAKNTLAEAEADKVRIEREKEDEKLKEIKRQKALAFFKLFASYAEKDPNTALTKALRDTILAEAVAGAFYTGTEKVEDDLKGAKRHGGKDGYRIDVDGSERIMTGEQNKLVGELTNEQLADLAYKHNNGLLDNAKFATNTNYDFASRMQDSALLMATMQTNKRLESLENALKSRPVTSWNFDGYGDFIKTTIENGITKKTTHKQNKPRI